MNDGILNDNSGESTLQTRHILFLEENSFKVPKKQIV